MKEHEEGFSMPLGAPLYQEPPFWGMPKGALMLMAYKADPEAVAWEVPEPLEVDEPGLMFAWFSDLSQPTHTIDLYHECVLGIKIRFEDYRGWYIPYIWVDHDMALTFSRELYGWPAALCDPTPLRTRGSQIFGECIRYDEPLMRMSMNVTSPPPQGREASIEDEFWQHLDGNWIQVRKLPNPAKGGKPIKQVLNIPPEDFKINEIWSGPATLDISKSGRFPNIHNLNALEVLGSWYLKSEWVVPWPEVIWSNA